MSISVMQEVWQYGSNNNPGDPDRDPLQEQDGVAPQCAVSGIEDLEDGISYGRTYIPSSVATKGFTGSHSINNYGWVFTKLFIGDAGYVKQR